MSFQQSFKKFLGSWIIDYEMIEIDSTAKKQAKQEAEAQAQKETEEKAKQVAEAQAKKAKQQTSKVTVPPPETGDNLVWVPTNGGTKYHSRSNCSNMKNLNQVTKTTAETNGFTPCGRRY